jgi:hypothetical protein
LGLIGYFHHAVGDVESKVCVGVGNASAISKPSFHRSARDVEEAKGLKEFVRAVRLHRLATLPYDPAHRFLVHCEMQSIS